MDEGMRMMGTSKAEHEHLDGLVMKFHCGRDFEGMEMALWVVLKAANCCQYVDNYFQFVLFWFLIVRMFPEAQ